MTRNLKSFLPKSLYGRAALILIMPVVLVQLLVSLAFIQRHFDGVTRQMTTALAAELRLMSSVIDAAPDAPLARSRAAELALPLEFQIDWDMAPPGQDLRAFWDWSGRSVADTLRDNLGNVAAVDLVSGNWTSYVHLSTRHGPLRLGMDRRRVSAVNPHQLLVIMGFGSLVLTLIAFVFLRNQLVPITRLAKAAEAFGKGQSLPYRLRGATEVRAAGQAFLDMRERIERQLEQRTLLLSGVSHDLRTPMTRMKLGLSLLPEDPEVSALQQDLAAMERLVDEFLAFARGDAMEEPRRTDPMVLALDAVGLAARSHHNVVLRPLTENIPELRLRREGILRALANLIGNAARFGKIVQVSVFRTEAFVVYCVEDDGPGIPEDQRDKAMQPFHRLDAARDPNQGGGVGLGLAIVADVARSHGGELVLGKSTALGGLRAELRLAA